MLIFSMVIQAYDMFMSHFAKIWKIVTLLCVNS